MIRQVSNTIINGISELFKKIKKSPPLYLTLSFGGFALISTVFLKYLLSNSSKNLEVREDEGKTQQDLKDLGNSYVATSVAYIQAVHNGQIVFLNIKLDLFTKYLKENNGEIINKLAKDSTVESRFDSKYANQIQKLEDEINRGLLGLGSACDTARENLREKCNYVIENSEEFGILDLFFALYYSELIRPKNVQGRHVEENPVRSIEEFDIKKFLLALEEEGPCYKGGLFSFPLRDSKYYSELTRFKKVQERNL